eukprot:759199-Amphidinium_carterae.1
MSWITFPFEQLEKAVQDNCSPPTMKHLLQADRVMFVCLAEETRLGTTPTVEGHYHDAVSSFSVPSMPLPPSSGQPTMGANVQLKPNLVVAKGSVLPQHHWNDSSDSTARTFFLPTAFNHKFNGPSGCKFAKAGKKCMRGFL